MFECGTGTICGRGTSKLERRPEPDEITAQPEPGAVTVASEEHEVNGDDANPMA